MRLYLFYKKEARGDEIKGGVGVHGVRERREVLQGRISKRGLPPRHYAQSKARGAHGISDACEASRPRTVAIQGETEVT